MPNFINWIFRIIIVFAIAFFAIQPFNWFCQITNKCQTFHLSYYLPKKEGIKPIKVDFGITNYRENLEFDVSEPSITTVSGRNNTVTYRAKNNSNHIMRLYPKLEIEPASVEKYITRYECLCSRQYKLMKGEEIEMRMRFEVSERIEEDTNYRQNGNVVKIWYVVK